MDNWARRGRVDVELSHDWCRDCVSRALGDRTDCARLDRNTDHACAEKTVKQAIAPARVLQGAAVSSPPPGDLEIASP